MKLWNLSIRRPKFTIVIMLVLLILGAVSLSRLPIQLFPDVEAPAAAVTASYPGAGPEEVLSDVTKELEGELSDTSGLESMTSQSMEGASIIIMEFSPETNIDNVETEIVSTINQADLPDTAGSPTFLKFDPSLLPSMQLAVASGGDEVIDFQEKAADLNQELSRVNGVADVSESGTVTERYEVVLNQQALQDNGLSQDAIVQTIQAQQATVPGGVIVNEDNQETISTRVLSELASVEDLRQITVGQNVTLQDVADVSLTPEDQDIITRVDEKPAIQFEVTQESDANTAAVSREVNDELDDLLEDEEYSSLEVVSIYDEGEFVQASINSVITALISGGILAMLVLFAFLRNLKTPLIIGIAIPFSIIVTFALFFFTDISLNMMTLGGLALGIGMLVDNSIVVVENIYRHLAMGKTPKQAASEGTQEVAGAITASTLTTVSIFLPVVFISGIAGDLFAPLSIAVAFSLFASLFVAVTIVPMLASRILKTPTAREEAKRKTSRFMRGMEKASRWSLRRRALVLLITAATLVIGALGLTTTGVEFLPTNDEGMAMVEVELDEGTSLSRTEETVSLVEQELAGEDVVDHYMSTIGATAQGASMGGGSESNIAEVFVTLKDQGERDQSTQEFIDEFSDQIEGLDDAADITMTNAASSGVGGEPNTYSFTIEDPNAQRLSETSTELIQELEDESDIEEVTSSEEDAATELQATVDKEAARQNGLAPAQVAQAIRSATTGTMAGSITTDSDESYDVTVKYPDDVLNSRQNFENITIANGQGGYVTLSEVATIEEGGAPTVINRADQVRSADFTVRFNPSSDLSDISEIVETTVDDIELADEAEFVVGGDQELVNDLIADVTLAFILGLVFIYLVMSAQFESFKHPFIIMFTVPMLVIGVMLALTVTQKPISAMALIGVVVLGGIVVNNAIVLVDYVNQQREKGMNVIESLVTGVKDRTRPILITTITTVLGVLPLAFGIGEGSETIQPMGIVIIGGLISSTFLTLFVIPVIYSFFDKSTRDMNKKYLTPDGGVIYKRDLIERGEYDEKSEETESHESHTDLPESEEESDKSYSKDDILEALEELVNKNRRDK
ncbi:efflux RND transporter permease subunit [Salimicrobium halophilum]|uniref:Hydrophobic/amphiphilic exporter-1, HAE1 family n=1 Tax=Salimicrobium halophilum TaxID=86666 RepID=A0A1G8R0Z7_9BACI|nr:efflux RND transporter permease subunit [Salimicrobium halophilum]SDJ10652.1 hydrophobic/amphiphilic exporter-1, HAE1 family [Salimicrobium halophilum]